jgi:hypothetical protein
MVANYLGSSGDVDRENCTMAATEIPHYGPGGEERPRIAMNMEISKSVEDMQRDGDAKKRRV